jgi:hypothetical protein
MCDLPYDDRKLTYYLFPIIFYYCRKYTELVPIVLGAVRRTSIIFLQILFMFFIIANSTLLNLLCYLFIDLHAQMYVVFSSCT